MDRKTKLYLSGTSLLLAPGGGYLGSPQGDVQFVPRAFVGLNDEGSNVRVNLGPPPILGMTHYLLQFSGTVGGAPHRPHIFRIDASEGSRIIGTKDEVYGPFQGADHFTEMRVATVGIDGGESPVGTIITAMRGPGQVVYSAGTGAAAGEITFTVLPPLPDDGDGAAPGDGNGGAMTLQISFNGEDYVDQGALTLGTQAFAGFEPGAEVSIQARARTSWRAGEPGDVVVAIAKGEVGTAPTVVPGAFPVQNLVAGDPFVVDWDTKFSGATLDYEIVTGLTGGISSGTRLKDYTVAALAVGNTTLQVRASNAFGSTLANWQVNVASAVVGPTIIAEPEDVVVGVGGNFSIDLTEVFGGTAPSYASTPASATIGVSGSEFKNLAALTAPAAASYTITATNAAGSASVVVAVTVTAARPAKLVDADVDFGASTVRFTSPARYIAPVVTFPLGIPGRNRFWSTGTPVNDVIPESQYEPLALGAGPTGPAGGPWGYVTAFNPGTRTVTLNWFGGTGPFSIAWGDGQTTSGAVAPASHTYAAAGTYSAVISDATTPTPKTSTVNVPTPTLSGQNYVPYMRDPAKAGVFSPTRLDYSAFGDTESTRKGKFRVAFEGPTGILSFWSDQMTVPGVVDPPNPALPGILPAVMKEPGTQAAELVGCPGIQFERVVFRDKGTRFPNHVFTIQDENRIWFSEDDGENFTHLPMCGMWGSKGTGGYANSDDGDGPNGLFIAVVHGWGYRDGGIFVSHDWGKTAKRLNTGDRGGDSAFDLIANGQRMRVPQNTCDRRPQVFNASGAPTLTGAQRPMYFIEQVIGISDFTIKAIYVWKSTNIDALNANSQSTATVSQVAQLPLATYANGDESIYSLTVCPNGDVILAGRKGVSIIQDEDWNNPRRILEGKEVIGVHIFGGDANTPSGAYFGDASGGGVSRIANIRTGTPSRPNGNAGLGATASLNCFGIWPGANGVTGAGATDKMMVGKIGSLKPYRSVDGGQNWTQVNYTPLPGDTRGGPRYGFDKNMTGGHHCLSPSKGNPNRVLALTNQTMMFSTDGGLNFAGAKCAFFDGSHTHGRGEHRTDWLKQCVVQQDRVFAPSIDGLLSVDFASPISAKLPIKHPATGANTTLGAVLVQFGAASTGPESGSNCIVGGNNRYVLFMRFGPTKCVPVLIGPDGGDPIGEVIPRDNSVTKAHKNFVSPADADNIFCGRFCVNGWGAAELKNVNFVDHNFNGVKEIIGYSWVGGDLRTYWTSEAGSTTQIYVSTTPTGSGGTLLKTVDNAFDHERICADPFTKDRFLYVKNGGATQLQIRELKPSGTGWSDTLMVDLKPKIIAACGARGLAAGELTIPGNMQICHILADFNMPGLFYAVTAGGNGQDRVDGAPCIWRTVNDGVDWIDITGVAPLTNHQPDVSRLTGNFMTFSSQGTWVWETPPGYPNIAAKNAMYLAQRDFYAKPNVPNPPTPPGF